MKIIISMMAVLMPLAVYAASYTYEKRIMETHVVHIVHLNSHAYQAEIIKATPYPGRETVSSIAQKASAEIAINGGFFETGEATDGKPSGTLMIKGKVYKLKKSVQPLVIIKNGLISIKRSSASKYKDQAISLVSGIPMLVERSRMVDDLFKRKGGFYTEPHARTAIGIDGMGRTIMVVAEAEGLTILELAKLMQTLGCQYAVNLDGGGSSTLWMSGKVVNDTIGDQDEAQGRRIERPVSDAIVFIKRN